MRLRSLGLVDTTTTEKKEKEEKNDKEWTEKRVVEFIKGGKIIGRGGVGAVYANPAVDKNVAIKVSTSKITCRNFESEYEIAQEIHRQSVDYKNELARVVVIIAELPAIELEKGFTHCALVMQLVHRPQGLPHADSELSYQEYIAKPTYSKLVPGRGIYLGAAEIAPLFAPKYPLEQLATSLGSLLGMLHYQAKCDANDMEYLVGYIESKRRIQIVALDFDRVKFYTTEQMKSAEVLERYYWSIDQEFYFPKPEEPLYEQFKAAYFAEAENNSLLEIAKLVIEKYESENAR